MTQYRKASRSLEAAVEACLEASVRDAIACYVVSDAEGVNDVLANMDLGSLIQSFAQVVNQEVRSAGRKSTRSHLFYGS